MVVCWMVSHFNVTPNPHRDRLHPRIFIIKSYIPVFSAPHLLTSLLLLERSILQICQLILVVFLQDQVLIS